MEQEREKQIHRVEAWMSVATVSIVVVQVFSIWTDWSWLPDDTRFKGCLTGMIGDVIFLIAVITMKIAGELAYQKKVEQK